MSADSSLPAETWRAALRDASWYRHPSYGDRYLKYPIVREEVAGEVGACGVLVVASEGFAQDTSKQKSLLSYTNKDNTDERLCRPLDCIQQPPAVPGSGARVPRLGMTSAPCQQLLQHLMTLERRLHEPAVRRDAAALSALLHEDFLEHGRSGLVYTKHDILERLPDEKAVDAIVADGFAFRRLGPHSAMLTYQSAHLLAGGERGRLSLRMSVWQRAGAGWKMVFHQGTPTDALPA